MNIYYPLYSLIRKTWALGNRKVELTRYANKRGNRDSKRDHRDTGIKYKFAFSSHRFSPVFTGFMSRASLV